MYSLYWKDQYATRKLKTPQHNYHFMEKNADKIMN